MSGVKVRMPDRLHYSIEAEPGVRALRCPPMTLLTLVEEMKDLGRGGYRMQHVRMRRVLGRSSTEDPDG